MYSDNILLPVRTKAVLTDAYVAGTLIEDAQKYSKLSLFIDFVKGSLTSAEVKVEFANELYYDLAYDGQSANFTVGATITGAQSGATGVIIADTDGGTSGTLTISRGSDNTPFLDNEVLADNNETPGAAVVNGTLSVSSFTFHQETTTYENLAGTTVNDILKVRVLTETTAKYAFPIPTFYRYVRVSAKGTGTMTNSLLGIKAVLA